MQIREASESDIPRIVEMASRSLVEGPYAGIIKDVPERAKKCADMVMHNGLILLAVKDDEVIGVLGFIVADHHFSGQRYAAELMWWVEPEHRKGESFSDIPALNLLREAEQRAKALGAESMTFTAPNDDVAHLYKRFGYSKLEVAFQKVFN